MKQAIKEMCWAATEAVLADKNILILSDRAQGPDRIPMPALLATAAVHHHLVRQGLRMQTGLVVETGEAREVHHFCVLAGYGAEAINPYVAFETLEDIRVRKELPLDRQGGAEELHQGGRQGHPQGHVQDGHLDLPVLLRRADLRRGRPVDATSSSSYFTGTATTIEGVGLAQVAEETVRRHAAAYGDNPIYRNMLDVGGMYGLRLRGEEHAWTAENIASLQHAVRGNVPDKYQRVRPVDQRPVEPDADHPRADGAASRPTSRSTFPRSNRPAKSSSASPPAR